jgi:hypothetical protein
MFGTAAIEQGACLMETKSVETNETRAKDFTMRNQMPEFALDHHNPASETAFKANYLESLRLFANDASALRDVVNLLFDYGNCRETLVEWGVKAGYSLPYMRSLISKLLTSKGIRTRKPGAGRRSSSDVLAVVDLVRGRYGPERAPGLLRAAYREAKAQAAAEKVRIQSLIVVPQLDCQTRPVLISLLESRNPPIHQSIGGPLQPSLIAGASGFATPTTNPSPHEYKNSCLHGNPFHTP